MADAGPQPLCACGYNLKEHSDADLCPECGADVAIMIGPWRTVSPQALEPITNASAMLAWLPIIIAVSIAVAVVVPLLGVAGMVVVLASYAMALMGLTFGAAQVVDVRRGLVEAGAYFGLSIVVVAMADAVALPAVLALGIAGAVLAPFCLALFCGRPLAQLCHDGATRRLGVIAIWIGRGGALLILLHAAAIVISRRVGVDAPLLVADASIMIVIGVGLALPIVMTTSLYSRVSKVLERGTVVARYFHLKARASRS